MACIISFADARCKILLPFNGDDEQFLSFVSKRLGLKHTDKFYIVYDTAYNPMRSQETIHSARQLKPNQFYTILYIDQTVRKLQKMSRAEKLNKMRRKSTNFETLPFSQQNIALKSRRSYNDLLKKSAKLVAPLKN
mmetsp:Transcript_60903/g.96812  ORF Transcript_60903/g.96812 Transcript_60903/m.96812 type:complete len:136 (-) Transcript_60903:147-554(-)